MNFAKSLFNQEGTGSQALNAKMEGGLLAGDKTGSSSLEAPGARAMDGPGCCFPDSITSLPASGSPAENITEGVFLYFMGTWFSEVPGTWEVCSNGR